MRWIYHLLSRDTTFTGAYAPASLASEGFVHGSFLGSLAESARLYFPPDAALDVLQLDPRRLGASVALADTPRGAMPHVHGPIAPDAIRQRVALEALPTLPDDVRGTRIALLAFDGLTLLDLVGVLDPLSRIASMGFDPTAALEVVSAHRSHAWNAHGATLTVDRVRPVLAEYDLLVIPGGYGTRAMLRDEALLAWLSEYPAGRMVATVCTGSLLLGAMGRLKGVRATTHHSSLDALAGYGAEVVRERVVDAGGVITSGGVTAGIDLGLHLVARLVGEEAAKTVAAQMAWRV